MAELRNIVQQALQALYGCKLRRTKTSGNMRAFEFGELRQTGPVPSDEYSPHLSCPWRIEHEGEILTGSGDYYQRAENNTDPRWEVGMPWGTYQEQALRKLMGGINPDTADGMDTSDLLVVDEINVDGFGGFSLSLTGGSVLTVFPSSGRMEEWRLLPPGDTPHFVLGGRYGADTE